MLRVGINGYGTIGKRVADAVDLQEDMELVGVSDVCPDYRTRLGAEQYPFYTAIPERKKDFEDAGIEVKGTLDDLLSEVDLIVDCSPEGVGAKNKPKYEKNRRKAIFEGGEKHEVAGLSFNAYACYEKAIGKQYARVVSCNTTGLCRTLYPLKEEFGIRDVKVVIVRRAADPWESKKGPINAIEPVLHVPSHHGPDVQTIIPELRISTMAVKVPTTIMHLHSVIVELEKAAESEAVLECWERTPRIKFVSGEDGIRSTAQIIELARDLGRKRNDWYEVIVWRDGVEVKGKTIYYSQAIHQEANVIPENIDCIRALCELEDDKLRSIEKTDKAMGIVP